MNKRFDGDSAVVLAVTESTMSSAINEAYKVKGEYLTAASTMNPSGNVVACRAYKDF